MNQKGWGPATCVCIRPPGDSHAHTSSRTTVLTESSFFFEAQTTYVFIFSFSSFPLSPIPHIVNGFSNAVTAPHYHWLNPFPSAPFPAITTLIQAHINFRLMQETLTKSSPHDGREGSCLCFLHFFQNIKLLINNLSPLLRFTGLRGLCYYFINSMVNLQGGQGHRHSIEG